MNKIALNKLTLYIVLLAFLPGVVAFVDVNYVFNRNNVDILAFNCLDVGCNSVGTFSGSLLNGASTTNGQLAVRFPSSPSQFGYALYYTSQGTLPMEGLATWHSNGDPRVFPTQFNIDFFQAAACRSTIDQFTVTNDAQANVPLVINTQASLDALTHSAFFLVNNQVGFVPPQLQNNYYSVNTRVRLQVFNEQGVMVNQQTRDLVLFADSSIPVEFSFTPTVAGRYRAVVSTEITDDQCATMTPESSEKLFSVLPALPQNTCYALLNNLSTANPNPVINQNVFTTFQKTTNFADNTGALSPIPATASIQVLGPQGIVLSTNQILPANPDAVRPQLFSFNWTPTSAGQYSISVVGQGSSPLCANSSTSETVTLNLFVSDQPRFAVSFQIVDSITGLPVVNATVTLDGLPQQATDVQGRTRFANVLPGTYTYAISHPTHRTSTGQVQVINGDVNLFLAMDQANSSLLHQAIFTITDSVTRLPVVNAQVVMAGQTVFSDSSGTAIVPNIVDGTYAFSITHPAYFSQAGNASILWADVRIPVTLQPLQPGTFSISALVLDNVTSQPIADAFVSVAGAVGRTDVFGRAFITGLAPGQYPLTAGKIGYQSFTQQLGIVNQDVAVTLRLQPDSSLADNREVRVFIDAIRISDQYDAKARETVDVIVTFENTGDFDVENIKATVVSQELGLRASVGPDDLNIGQRTTKRLQLELPYNVVPGEYPVRITLSSDKVKRVVYRDVVVMR